MLTDLKKIFIERFPVNLQLNGFKNPTACVATLPCETLMSAKQDINDLLLGSVAEHLRCGEVVNNQIEKGLLLSLWVKFFFKSVNIWQSYK